MKSKIFRTIGVLGLAFSVSAVASEMVVVDGFKIDKYEVTNAEYKEFLDWVKQNGDASVRHSTQPENKDHTPRYWKNFRPAVLKKTGMAELQHFDDDTFKQPNQPVVGIDWYSAYAYAKWAGKRLPTETEWELAAAGPDGNLWPWGNEFAFDKVNSGGYEHKGERDGAIYLADVDSYPEGVSHYGVYNMAGNAWEFVDQKDGSDIVIKGGGSSSYPSSVTTASRKVYEPTFKSFNIGFRCVQDL